MDGNQQFDIGPNAETLGFGYLFFRFVWPVILITVLGVFLFFVVIPYIQAHPLNFLPPSLPQAPTIPTA